MMKYAELKTAKLAYEIYGTGKVGIIVELALGASMGEWRTFAEKAAKGGRTVLLYERAGIGSSGESSLERTPKNIAEELHSLLEELTHENPVIIIAHSQGGLYAQQFARAYPEMTKALILLDPLSANDKSFEEQLTPEELKKSGADKSYNLVIMEKLAKLHLGFLIKAVMKKAPPFYYYNDFSADDRDYILTSFTKPLTYRTAIQEYKLSHDEAEISRLRTHEGFPNIPLVLITHTSELAEKETMEFGGTTEELAKKVENIWQTLMKEYLAFSTNSRHIQAKHSSHLSMHLIEPELILDALEYCV